MTSRQCPKCGVRIQNKSHFYRHTKRCGIPEHRVSCHHCNKTFSRKDLCQRHMKKAHPVENSFCCSTCSKAFQYEMALHLHEERCGKDRPKPFKCVDCGKCFSRKATLQHHQQHVHQVGGAINNDQKKKKKKKSKVQRYLRKWKTSQRQPWKALNIRWMRFFTQKQKAEKQINKSSLKKRSLDWKLTSKKPSRRRKSLSGL